MADSNPIQTSIVNIRGTHGSGKSTLVKHILDLYRTRGSVSENTLQGRKRPFSYVCKSPELRTLFVPGHYETPGGGCDSIGEVAQAFDAVKTAADCGLSVLYEGILAQHSGGRLLELHRAHPVTVIALSTPLDLCIASVRSRRAERGASTDDFDPRNVEKEFRSVVSSSRTLGQRGMKIEHMSREDAYLAVVVWIETGGEA